MTLWLESIGRVTCGFNLWLMVANGNYEKPSKVVNDRLVQVPGSTRRQLLPPEGCDFSSKVSLGSLGGASSEETQADVMITIVNLVKQLSLTVNARLNIRPFVGMTQAR